MACPRMELDACTTLTAGTSVGDLPGDEEQLQLLEGSILATVRLLALCVVGVDVDALNTRVRGLVCVCDLAKGSLQSCQGPAWILLIVCFHGRRFH